jgi:hypothetical protein
MSMVRRLKSGIKARLHRDVCQFGRRLVIGIEPAGRDRCFALRLIVQMAKPRTIVPHRKAK